MFSYRPDQGVYARGTAFWSLGAFAFLAGRRFDFWVQGLFDWTNKELTASPVPVLGFPLTGAFLLGVGLFVLLGFGVWRAVNHPKLADLLINTEVEMKKVTWPSFEDAKSGSLVVIGCVLFMLVFLACSDRVLEWFFGDLVF